MPIVLPLMMVEKVAEPPKWVLVIASAGVLGPLPWIGFLDVANVALPSKPLANVSTGPDRRGPRAKTRFPHRCLEELRTPKWTADPSFAIFDSVHLAVSWW
jgi:hypothetical protein